MVSEGRAGNKDKQVSWVELNIYEISILYISFLIQEMSIIRSKMNLISYIYNIFNS